MRRKDTFVLVTCQLITTILIYLVGNAWAGLDAPHNTSTGTGCVSCHQMVSTHSKLLPPLNHTPLPGDIDDTTSNGLCWSCHNETIAPNVKTHSSLTTSTKYGNWTVECWVCHSQHSQEQDNYNGSTYGKFIRKSIVLDHITGLAKTGTRNVVFTNPAGANSFADGDTAINGVCEVCHTDTTAWHNDGTLSHVKEHTGLQGRNCTQCHPHSEGFKADYQCLDCHDDVANTETNLNRAAVNDQFSGNSHHVQRADGSIENTDCYQCHWEADTSGRVTDYHVAIPGAAVDLVIRDAGIGNGPDPRPDTYTLGATAIQYTAGSSTSLDLNPHCLGCHNDDLNGVDVFGDGKSPNHYAWDESSAGARDGTSVKARYSQTGSTTWGKYTTSGIKKNQTKAYSAHGNAVLNQGGGTPDTWTSTREGSVNVACFDCHNSHGSTVSGTTTSYISATVNGGLLKNTVAGKGGYTTTYAPRAAGSQKGKYTYSSGAALCIDCHQNNYSGAVPWGFYETYGATKAILGYLDNLNFGSADARITHSGGHFGVSSPLTTTPAASINGLCTPCHDPHGVSTTLDRNYGIPLLKGTWLTSLYRLDDAPPDNYSEWPGYFFDQNTLSTPSTIAEGAGQFAGLCLQCHQKTDIDPDNAGSNATWKSLDRVHDAVKGWGNNTQHNYPCSKCHLPHASARLPRLMQTNCMDYRHKGRVGYNANPSLEGSSGSFPYYGGCHGTNNNLIPGQAYIKEQYWNNVTRWEDRDDDDSVIYPNKAGLDGADCDDSNASIYRAADGTCDGDGDGVLDASAGGMDCDDDDAGIGFVPALCDQDGDGVIDWHYGGYDCDDTDPLAGASADGFCN